MKKCYHKRVPEKASVPDNMICFEENAERSAFFIEKKKQFEECEEVFLVLDFLVSK